MQDLTPVVKKNQILMIRLQTPKVPTAARWPWENKTIGLVSLGLCSKNQVNAVATRFFKPNYSYWLEHHAFSEISFTRIFDTLFTELFDIPNYT